MVDTSTHNNIIVSNPSTVRGHRTSFEVSPTHYFYAAKDNLVAKSRTAETTQSAVWCLNRDRITSVALSHDGTRVAFGDEKGKVTILKWKDNKFDAHKEHFLLMGIVNEILWSHDDKCIVALGENKGQLAACNPETGSRMGDVTGFTSTVLCGVFTAEKVLYTAGEGNEILQHQGTPFKGQGTQVKHPHTGFINQMRLSPDGSKFATCSADKSIAVFDAKDGTLIKHFTATHAMGIYDLCWVDNLSLLTCSADNLVKKWSVEADAAV
jgi:WD40 repeat protein